MSDVQAELHKYLAEKNINALIVSIVEAVLLDKPENPIGFIAKHLLEKYPDETKEITDRLKDEPPTSVVLETERSNGELSETGSDCSDCSSVNTNESVAGSKRHDDSSDAKPPARKKRLTTRRLSVCAEKITDEVMDSSDLKVVEKTEEESARIAQILKNNLFFGHLDETQIQSIQNCMFSVEKSDGDVIINQGDDGDNFFVIDNGTVEVYIDSRDTGERRLVSTLEEGASFGELALMYNAPRAASCIAKGDVRLYALDRVSFNVILMKTTIAKRKTMSDTLLKVPVFKQLTPYELDTIADTLQEETFGDKSIICRQGDRGDRFYLIESGTAVCTIAQDNDTTAEVARLSSGSYFGEVSIECMYVLFYTKKLTQRYNLLPDCPLNDQAETSNCYC